MPNDVTSAPWTFLTNHSHVLICLARDPELRLRDIADLVGISDRAVFTIIGDLEAAGFVERRKVGRRNRYEVHPRKPMRHAVESGHTVDELLDVMVPTTVPATVPTIIPASAKNLSQ